MGHFAEPTPYRSRAPIENLGQKRKSHPPKSTQNKKVHLDSFCRVPDSYHTEAGRSLRELFEKLRVNVRFFFRTRSTTTRDRNLQLRGAVSTGLFFEYSPLDFFVSHQVYSVVAQNVEKIARSPGREKRVECCHVSGCHVFFFFFFFGPDLRWAKSRDSIAEPLARVIAAIRIRIASVCWRSYLPRKHRN